MAKDTGPALARKSGLWSVRGREFGPPWMVCVGSFVVMLGLGVQYTWGTITVYFSSPGLLRHTPDTSTIYAFALATATVPLGMFLSTSLMRRIGPAVTCLIGALLVPAGLLLSSLSGHGLPVLLVCWGGVMGTGIGFSYLVAINVPQRWFPARKGLVSGISLMAFGGGSFFFNLLIRALANPTKFPEKPPVGEDLEAWQEQFHEMVERNLPRTLGAVAGISFLLVSVGSLFMQEPNKAARQKPSEESGEQQVSLVGAAASPESEELEEEKPVDLTPWQTLKTVQFHMLFVAYVCATLAGFFVVGSYSRFSRTEGTFTADYGLVGALGALGNALGRLTWGRLSDLLDYRRCLVIDTALLCILSMVYFETRGTYIGYTAVTVAIYFCFGGLFAVLPSAASGSFGTTHMGHNFTMIFLASSVGSVMQAILLNTLSKALGSFRWLFYITATFSAVACFIALAYHPPKRGTWFAIWKRYG